MKQTSWFSKHTIIFIVCFFCFNASALCSDNAIKGRYEKLIFPHYGSSWPPLGSSDRYPVTKDTWFSAMGNEKFGNNGGSQYLKLKGRQEFALVDCNVSQLKGKLVTGALFHFRVKNPDNAPFARIGISAVASDWEEGTGRSYRPSIGSSCFLQAAYKVKDWSYPGSTVMDVVFGKGNTLWKFSDSSIPDENGWQVCAIDPDIISAKVAGISYGLGLYDEVGTTWVMVNGSFNYNKYPNRFCFSRESRNSGPWIEIWTNGEDFLAPERIDRLFIKTDKLTPGQAVVQWKTHEDHGGGKTIGFNVFYFKNGQKHVLPRYLIPMAAGNGKWNSMHLRDLFSEGDRIELLIQPVDNAGNVGEITSTPVHFPAVKKQILDGIEIIPSFKPSRTVPEIGGVNIGIIDLLDKVDPVSGQILPSHEKGYWTGNHIFSAEKKLIRLQGAKNEFVSFQILFKGRSSGISVKAKIHNQEGLRISFFEPGYVKSSQQGKRHFLPDPLFQSSGVFSIPCCNGESIIADQGYHSIICEIYIPHGAVTGKKRGALIVECDKEILKFDIQLNVWDFLLPDKLSFIPEMNAYGLSFGKSDYEYYRLAHIHRTCLNRLPYGWKGVPYISPEITDQGFNWQEWDRAVGPLLDGTAFKNLPRKGQPVDVFYLPINENWPVPVKPYYTPSYWADEAFSRSYVKKFRKAVVQFSDHIRSKGWADPIFQFYLNNKVFYRKQDPLCMAPWVFDEPENIQDFWALRWYGLLWRSVIDSRPGNENMWYRCDISYSEFARNILSGISDVEYIGGNNSTVMRFKDQEYTEFGKPNVVEYGKANPIIKSNAIPAVWCLKAWLNGSKGILPWQTIGTEKSWKEADQNALFYPSEKGPVPSLRLKCFTRGQQDVEYFHLLINKHCMNRLYWAKELIAVSSFKKNIFQIEKHMVKPEQLWEIRYLTASLIENTFSKAENSSSPLGVSSEASAELPQIGYSRVSPAFKRIVPVLEN